jgi:hypothetical protein
MAAHAFQVFVGRVIPLPLADKQRHRSAVPLHAQRFVGVTHHTLVTGLGKERFFDQRTTRKKEEEQEGHLSGKHSKVEDVLSGKDHLKSGGSGKRQDSRII